MARDAFTRIELILGGRVLPICQKPSALVKNLRIMGLNKTATQALSELRVDVVHFSGQFKIEPIKLRAYLERMYDRYYKVVWTEENPHLIFVQAGLHRRVQAGPPIPANFRFKAQKEGNQRSFFILWTAEPVRLHKIADHTLSFYPDTTTNTWFPDLLNVLYEDFVAFLRNKPTQRALTNRQTPKTNFCAFIHHHYNPELTEIKVRNDFCAELMKYKKVLCPGLVMNNVQAPDYLSSSDVPSADHLTFDEVDEENYTIGLIRYLAECKFFICFENSLSSRQKPNEMRYVTLKILAAFIAGSIPIYSGYREIAELFNPAAFINVHDFSSHQELIEYIKEVDNSPELTAAYQNAPPILPDSPLHNVHPDKMRPLFLSLAERALERARGTKSPIFQTWYLRRSYHITLKPNLIRFIRRSVNYLKRKLGRGRL